MNAASNHQSRFAALQGQKPDAIDTPALVLDAEAVNRNMQRMAEFAAKHQIKLRPHAKLTAFEYVKSQYVGERFEFRS